MFQGACACGKVTFVIEQELKSVDACHCLTCQAWSGGISLYFEAHRKNVRMEGEDNLTLWKSSEYCERAFCKICGSSMYSRVTAAGEWENVYHFAAGALKNWDGIVKVEKEIFIDRKPDTYSLECDSEKMTSTEFYALFPEESNHDE